MTKKVKGTASVLEQTKNFDTATEKYGSKLTNLLVAHAINEALPNAKITESDIESYSKVTNAFRTGRVDVIKSVEEAISTVKKVVLDVVTEKTK